MVLGCLIVAVALWVAATIVGDGWSWADLPINTNAPMWSIYGK